MDDGMKPSMVMLEDIGTKAPVPLPAMPQYGGAAAVAVVNPPPPAGIALPAGYRLEIFLDAVPTNQLSWAVVYHLYDTHRDVKKTAAGLTTSATPVVAIAAAVSPDQAILEYFNIDNRDTAAATVTVQITNGTTTVRIRKATLQPGENLYFSAAVGWQVLGDLKDYLYKPGRTGGQTAYGGTGAAENLELRGSANASIGRVLLHMPRLADDALNPTAVGDMTVVGTQFRFYDTTVRSIAPFNFSASYANGYVPIWNASTAQFDPALLAVQNKLTPAAIAANQNDYNPTGLSSASVLRLAASGAGREITGIAAGSQEGRFLIVQNIGSLFLTLKHENAGSAAGNRFSFGSTDISLWTGDAVLLEYDTVAGGATGRWKCVAKQVSQPSFAVHKNAANQTVNTGAGNVKVTWATEVYDSHGWFDLANERFQPLLPGKYLCTWSVCFSSIADARLVQSILFKNGVSHLFGARIFSAVAGGLLVTTGSRLVDMNGSSDFVEIYATHDDTVNRDISGQIDLTGFEGVRICD